ncbi:MAG: GTP-binding protein [Butyrivibrio sp.]|nr:GTP-binding protein [Butyrivibrio sp.]
MAKVTIISGFLGAGKTTFIRKLLEEVYKDQKVVLIENEFGEIGIDGGFLKDAGVQVNEMNSGCICCSLVGDFGKALKQVSEEYSPDIIIIEPSGVGKLSDVIAAVENVKEDAGLELENFITVADGTKCRMYMKNFGEFYNNQIESASAIVLSRTQNMKDEKLEESVALIREHNDRAAIITTPWDELSGEQIVSAMKKTSLVDELLKELDVCPVCGHHHDDEDEDHEHCHHHHHDDDEDGEHEHEHCHHHHHDDDEDGEHEHEHCHHHHDDDEDGEHEHCHHHHHHHADDVFNSWGAETPHKYDREELEGILKRLVETEEFGVVLRAKGMVPSKDGAWIYFDAVPGEYELRDGQPEYTGKLCVIGTNVDGHKMEELFGL